jgi:hypothetical protein
MDSSNNKLPPHGGFQGLLFTDYRPNKSRYVQVFDNNQYRMYLQQNAEKIMKDNLSNIVKNTGFCSNGTHKDSSEIVKYNDFKPYDCSMNKNK